MLPPETPKQLKEIEIREIIHESLKHIDSYKNGVEPKESISNWAQYKKPYHNRDHTDFVMREIEELFQEEFKKTESPLMASDGMLCQLLAGTHDYDQQENSSGKNYNGGNEKRSVAWLVPTMQKNKFDETEIEIAKIGLIGTWTPVVRGGTPEAQLKQVAGEFGTGGGPESTLQEKMADLESKYGIPIDPEIFKNPRAIAIAKLLADADLAALGNTWDIYWKNMVLFFREQHPEIKDDSINSTNKETWKKYLKFQVNLLNNHHYHTPAAQTRYPNCLTNSSEVSRILKPGNETLFNASFEAMLTKDGTYNPPSEAMDVISA